MKESPANGSGTDRAMETETPPDGIRRTEMDSGIDAALGWYAELERSSNAAFMPLYFDRHRYLVLMGGGGSGKSGFAARKVLERATGEPGSRHLVCRKVARTLKESCFALLCELSREHYPDSGMKANRSDLHMSFANGSEIIFAGLDDPEKLKSVHGIRSVWIEEASELSEADFNQLDLRLRGSDGGYRQIILSFNPTSVNHWLKRRFFDRSDGRALVHHSTWRDNRFLDEENIRTLESFKGRDDYYYNVYSEGIWGGSGRSVFPEGGLTERLRELRAPESRGDFIYSYDGLRVTDIRFAEGDGGISVYRKPERGVPYVIGADTAGGGSDYFAAQVIDNRSGEQAAVLHIRDTDEDVFARQLYCLGRYYNDALIAVECNFSSYPVMELDRLGYPRQYVRESYGDFAAPPKSSYGFRTDSLTRPLMIGTLISVIRDGGARLINDEGTVYEMLSFVRNAELRAEAEPGAHDDLVMSLAIAHFVRPQQSYVRSGAAADTSGWTADMISDYEAADAAGKKYLLEKWSGGNEI